MFIGGEVASSGVTEGVVLVGTADYPSKVSKLDTIIGHAGWEGVQVDSAGNLWLIADQSGATGMMNI